MKEIFIHYGSNKFEPEKFCTPVNSEYDIKPMIGGLWASPTIDVDFSWKQWCEAEDFRECKDEESFKFTLKDNARVLILKTPEDLKHLRTISGKEFKSMFHEWDGIDFEFLSQDYDAILVYMYRGKDYWSSLRNYLNTWDCDSLLVLNKDVIEVIE